MAPAYLEELREHGFVVVPNVIPQSACEEFQESALQWLEAFPHGFKRGDKSTWTAEHLPYGHQLGLYSRYGVNQEDFVWKIRAQPGIRKVFEEVWGTDDLIVSFDAVNISLPVNAEHGRTDIQPTGAWPHIDQNPRRVHLFELYQGIANLAPNGPNDGGLVVLKDSHKLHDQFFAETGGWKAEQDAGEDQNGYSMTKADADWYRQHGCQEVKVCAGPGDLILWDSRTIHWNASPRGQQTRFVTYVCMCPRSMATEEALAKKLETFKSLKGTTHWPNLNVVPVEHPDVNKRLPKRPDGSVDPANRLRPVTPPQQTPEILRLVGVRA